MQRLHDANCWLTFNDELYFGNNTGWVCKADTGSADHDEEIVAIGQTAYSAGKNAGQLKRFSMCKPLVLSERIIRVSVGVSADFKETNTFSTPSAVLSNESVWGEFSWGDGTVYGGGAQFLSDWTSTPALGCFASVKFTARSAVEVGEWGSAVWGSSRWGIRAPDITVQVNGFVVLAEPGGFV